MVIYNFVLLEKFNVNLEKLNFKDFERSKRVILNLKDNALLR